MQAAPEGRPSRVHAVFFICPEFSAGYPETRGMRIALRVDDELDLVSIAAGVTANKLASF
jgi:hypothetical protein